MKHYRKTKHKLEEAFNNFARTGIISKQNRAEWRMQVAAFKADQEDLMDSLTNKEDLLFVRRFMADLNNPEVNMNEQLKSTEYQQHSHLLPHLEKIHELHGHLENALTMLSGMAKIWLFDDQEKDNLYHSIDKSKIKKGFLLDSVLSAGEKKTLLEKGISHLTFLNTVSGINALEADILFLHNALNGPPPKNCIQKIQQIMIHALDTARVGLSHIRFDRKVRRAAEKADKKPKTP